MAKQAVVAATKPTIFARLEAFYQDVRSEMSKVAWPGKEELKSSTSIVLSLLVILAAVIGLYDMVFQFVTILLLRVLG